MNLNMILCKTGAKIEDTKHNIPQVPSNKISDLTTRLATDSAGPNRSEPDGPEPNQTKKRYIDRMGVRVGGGALLWSVRPKARHFASVGEFHISRQDHQGGRNMGVATWGAHGREGAGRAGVRLALLGLVGGSCRMRRAASPRGKLWTLSHSGTSVWAGVEGAVEVKTVQGRTWTNRSFPQVADQVQTRQSRSTANAACAAVLLARCWLAPSPDDETRRTRPLRLFGV